MRGGLDQVAEPPTAQLPEILSDELQPEKKQAESEDETAQRGHGHKFRDANGPLQAPFPADLEHCKMPGAVICREWNLFEKPLAADGLAG